MKPEDIQHFLVTYFTSESRVAVQEFGNDHDAAMAAYIDLEKRYRDRDDLDIVLLGADSLETVKRTHSSYFGEGKSAFAHLFDEDGLPSAPAAAPAAATTSFRPGSPRPRGLPPFYGAPVHRPPLHSSRHASLL
jgi:hypothetical protein